MPHRKKENPGKLQEEATSEPITKSRPVRTEGVHVVLGLWQHRGEAERGERLRSDAPRLETSQLKHFSDVGAQTSHVTVLSFSVIPCETGIPPTPTLSQGGP